MTRCLQCALQLLVMSAEAEGFLLTSQLTTFEEAVMRRFLIVAVLAVALFAVVAPPVFAQAPTPKVTITGLFDQVTAGGYNFYDGNYSRNNDREWYARTRFRPDFAFEVGRTKAVLGIEIDLQYGQGGATDGGFPGNVTGAAPVKAGANGGLDLNTDVGGMLEVKWIYTEFDLTGKDSLMPFIPVLTVARAGGQPFATIGNYKTAYATGDFAGLDLYTTFADNLKTHLAYVMVEEDIATFNRGSQAVASSKATRGEDMAFIFSPEYTPIKGLDLKPLYSYFQVQGATSSQARRAAINRFNNTGTLATTGVAGASVAAATSYSVASTGGVEPYAGGRPDFQENRHTIGLDARWRWGAFGLDPTIYYQWGTRDQGCLCPINGAAFGPITRVTADMSSWFVDIAGSWQSGPLLLEARGIYSTGNEARDNLARSVHYFEPLDLDTSYYAGWAQIWALGVDYFNGGGAHNNGMSTNVGYDRYGRAGFGVRGTYNLTPALAFYTVVSPMWTAQKVDTDTGQGAGIRTIVNDKSFVKGDESYLGTEWDLGMTWKFAPNVAFDLVGAWLFAGAALDTAECLGGAAGSCAGGTVVKREAQDAWTITSRVRLSF
jgi:hypothetical protein